MVKLLLLLLFAAAVVSLFCGLFFLLRDPGNRQRIVVSLYLRVGFCVLIVLLLLWGFYTGELASQAPWLTR
ncbi:MULTISPECIES: twin transmembrane helix small protein [Neptunomonas]|uniref:Twin transmembrane helix small protein n=1 Tax=Neptunomonas marina TaxID=1815562 RepID=A0A437QAE5_9GAMM|nr:MULTISPECIES: twin transmembrane helix small protein [Neptunomonas]RVU31495.1 twin transmembrane helix small protein [Neptunomonas marina]